MKKLAVLITSMIFLYGCSVSEFTSSDGTKYTMLKSKWDADFTEWGDYIFLRENKKGTQTEWWFHRSGCQSWFLVERDTTNNSDHKSFWYKDLKQKK